jgi:hypothetical protein
MRLLRGKYCFNSHQAGSSFQFNTTSYGFPKAVLKRIFALEAFWLFYECKLLAEKFNSKNVYSFNTAEYITNSFVPHWLIEEYPENSAGELFEIYYRLQLSRLEEFSNFGEPHELS